MKMTRLLFLAVTFAAFASVGAAQDVRKTIETAIQKFVAELKAGNAAGIAAMYAEDAQAFPPGAEVIRGRADIQKFWQGLVDAKLTADLQTADVESQGNLAVETGTLTLKDASGNVLDRGKYVVTWKRGKDGWKLYRDIWNSSLPQPAPAK
jgi:ketosteroid isomerase-like protein